jgi:hypothetical protein
MILLNEDNRKPKGFERFKQYIQMYKKLVDYNVPFIKNYQQIANTHGEMLKTNFIVNVQENFIKKIKTFTSSVIIKKNIMKYDSLVGIKRNKKDYVKELQRRNRIIQDCIFTTDYVKLTKLLSVVDNLEDIVIIETIKNILPDNPCFEGIPYDLKARTSVYVESYYKLSLLYEKHQMIQFNFVPLSTSSIPRHITIDTKTLALHVLKLKQDTFKISEDKLMLWESIFNLGNKAFKSRSSMDFDGMIRTDGISCCVLIKNTSKKKAYGSNRGKKRKREKTEYFQDNLEDISENKVFIDPNVRDLLYCLGNNGKKLRYTSMQRRRETHSKINERKRRALGKSLEKNVFPNSNVTIPSKKTLNVVAFNLYLKEFFERLKQDESFYQRKVFRKQRFKSFIFTRRSELKFTNKVKETFGEDSTILIGDYSVASMKYQSPRKGVGFRNMFKKAGFHVFLVNEFLTSSICPICELGKAKLFLREQKRSFCEHRSLETFKKRESSRPWRKTIQKVHGLLRCQSEICQLSNGKERLWNRDDVATENIKAVVIESTRNNGERPKRFCRENSKEVIAPLSEGSE